MTWFFLTWLRTGGGCCCCCWPCIWTIVAVVAIEEGLKWDAVVEVIPLNARSSSSRSVVLWIVVGAMVDAATLLVAANM